MPKTETAGSLLLAVSRLWRIFMPSILIISIAWPMNDAQPLSPHPGIIMRDTRHEIGAEAKISILETFDIAAIHPQLIQIQTTEFSAVCPGTGLPDIAKIEIEYIPQVKCIELKSLKYYFFSYRNDPIFQEPVTDLIFDHLWRVLSPQYLKITVIYNTRGGFDTTTLIENGDRTVLNQMR
jgi:7-cyano-7-deazaguanine reductase